MNEETMKGKWAEIKGEILNQWGKMTNDELDKSKGNLASIAGIIQQRYGAKKEEIEQRLNGIISNFSQATEETKNKMREDSARH